MSAHVHSPDSIAAVEAAYRRAFAEYAAEVHRLQLVNSHDALSQERAFRRVRDAERKYREQRDSLAQVMLMSLGAERNVRSVAHAIWERAGRPSGTAESDWFRAERILLLAR